MNGWFGRSRLDPQGEANVVLWVFVAVLVVSVCVALGASWFAPPQHAALARDLRNTALVIVLMLGFLGVLLATVRKMLDL